jgi:hypothetical protein
MARTKWRVVGISEHRQSGQFQEGLRRMPDFLEALQTAPRPARFIPCPVKCLLSYLRGFRL